MQIIFMYKICKLYNANEKICAHVNKVGRVERRKERQKMY